MSSPIHHMKVFQYYRDDRPWDSKTIVLPSWSEVEDAIQRMDNYCFPFIWLNCHADDDHDEADDIFNVIGGDGRWALLHMMLEWQYEDPNGPDDEVRLWDSDQGYFCKAKNIITDVERVLRIVRSYYETGSYKNLDAIASEPPLSEEELRRREMSKEWFTTQEVLDHLDGL